MVLKPPTDVDAGLRFCERLEFALDDLKGNKPNDRGDQDRRWAIVITETQKLLAIARAFLPATDL